MRASELKGKKLAFAASGGLDSCTITRWLSDLGVEVICFTADLGQTDEISPAAIRERMMACGAKDFVLVDAKRNLVEQGMRLIHAQACYEGRYWNTTAIARHVTVQEILPEMQKRGIKIFSHGATGRGNDQVRFQLVANMLDPQIEVYAPWRDAEFLARFGGRKQMIDFCEERKLPIKASHKSPYSTDANILGLTHEAGILESLSTGVSAIDPGMGVHAVKAPDTAEVIEVEFKHGLPVAINGRADDLVKIFSEANNIGGRHGIGIATHLVENRFVGIKSRGVYESPGMELLGSAYAYLLQVVLDRRARELFDELSRVVAKQIYQGYGFDLASSMADAAIARTSKLCSGKVKIALYKGGVSFVALTDAPHSLYSEENASMEDVGSYNHADSEGLLRVLGVGARALAVMGQVKTD